MPLDSLLTAEEGMHPHPIMVHFSIAYAVAVSLLSLLYIFTGKLSFETGSYYMLVLGFLAAPVAALSGIFTWKVSYEGEMKGNEFLCLTLSIQQPDYEPQSFLYSQ